MDAIETDYLVIGAGAAGMAFADALIAASDAEVVLVDRRHGPGGHWHDAYPFVRLHGPSALYGVNSRRLGSDVIDRDGPNAPHHPRATAAEICAYYQQVLDEQLLPSGRVRFFGMSDYGAARDGHQFTSRLTGQTTMIRVRRRVVDARYLEPSIPATHVPPFGIESGTRLIPVNDLVGLSSQASGFTILGGGKTAIERACGFSAPRAARRDPLGQAAGSLAPGPGIPAAARAAAPADRGRVALPGGSSPGRRPDRPVPAA